jgi:hypothetical protein
MVSRERLCGECLWIVNMATCGVDGVLVSVMGCMGLVYGNLLNKVGGSSLGTLDLKWRMAPRLHFGMTCSIGSSPLR